MGKSLKKWTTVALSFAVACAAVLPMTAFAAEGDVAEVDGTGYQTVQAAIDAADGKTVILLADTQENVTIAKDTTITLDLGTFTLTNKDAKHTITNQGTLKVVGTGKVDNVNHGQAALWNEGVANLNGGTFDRSKDAGTSADTSNNNSYYTIVNHGTMTINDGVTVQQPGKYSSLLENGWYNGAQNTSGEPSVLTINGGTFTGGLNTIKNDDYGQLTIEGGTFTNVAQAALLNWNEAEISGGTFKVDEGAPYVVLNGYLDDTMDQGQLTITDGTFTGGEDTIALATMGGSANSGAVEIAGGRFDGDIVLQGTQAGGLLEIADEAVINGDVTNGGLDEVVISGGTVSGAVANNGEGTLSITGRDVDTTDTVLEFNKDTYRWRVLGDLEDRMEQKRRDEYERNPIVQTIRILLQRSPLGWTGTASELFQECIDKAGTYPAADETRLSKLLKPLAPLLFEWDGIVYKPPGANGGGGGRKHTFTRKPTAVWVYDPVEDVEILEDITDDSVT